MESSCDVSISTKWEDPRTTWSGFSKENPRPSGRGVYQYATATNAIRRGVELAILTGHPGDVLEVSSSHFGFLIATVKLAVGANNLVDLQVKFHVTDQLETERRLHSKAKL